MKTIAITVVVTALIITSSLLAVQNQQLRSANMRLLHTSELVLATNQGFEAALTSCRLSIDTMVAKSQEHTLARLFENYRYLPFSRGMRVARLDDGTLQARQ